MNKIVYLLTGRCVEKRNESLWAFLCFMSTHRGGNYKTALRIPAAQSCWSQVHCTHLHVDQALKGDSDLHASVSAYKWANMYVNDMVTVTQSHLCWCALTSVMDSSLTYSRRNYSLLHCICGSRSDTDTISALHCCAGLRWEVRIKEDYRALCGYFRVSRSLSWIP